MSINKGIILELVDVNLEAPEYSFRIKNADRTIKFDWVVPEGTVKLRSSSCPEAVGTILFLQGEGTTEDNRVVTCTSAMYMQMYLLAIREYNHSIGVKSNWIQDFKFPCVSCGCLHPLDMMCTDLRRVYCLSCRAQLKICESCGVINAHIKFLGKHYCSNCIDEDSTCQYCFDTTATLPRQFTIPSDYHGEHKHILLCETCYPKDIVFGKEHHYHHKPDQWFFWDFKKGKRIKQYVAPSKNLYMGMEIEGCFDRRSHTNLKIAQILDVYGHDKEHLLFCKHDGTVPEPGTETVTHPMTLDMIRSLSWNGICNQLIKPIHEGIGGHIHVNKNAFFSMGHTYKFLKFLRTNIQYVEWVGERVLQRDWCKAHSGNGKVVSITKKFRENQNVDRYEMINFTDKTIELRFFAAPYRPQDIYKNTEFVDGLFRYTINAPLHFNREQFEKFMCAEQGKYPWFFNFMQKRPASQTFESNQEYFSPTRGKIPREGRVISSPIMDDVIPSPMYCEDCDREIYEDSAIYVNDSHYCTSCVSYCEWCEEYYRGPNHRVYDRRRQELIVCDYCFEDGFVRCDNCNSYYNNDNVVYDSHSEHAYCTFCDAAGNIGEHHRCPTCNELIDNNEECASFTCTHERLIADTTIQE